MNWQLHRFTRLARRGNPRYASERIIRAIGVQYINISGSVAARYIFALIAIDTMLIVKSGISIAYAAYRFLLWKNCE